MKNILFLADKLWKEKLDVSNENVFQEKSNDANKQFNQVIKANLIPVYISMEKSTISSNNDPISSCETFDRALKVCYKTI